MIDKQRTNLADVEYLDLDDVAKIINDFENPVIENVKNDDDVENTSLRLADDDDIFAQAQRIADEEERKRRNEDDDIRMKEKLDDKTLVGVHNISDDKLLKALKLGGLANPSAAVIDISKSSHDDYGDISLVMPSRLVDKRTGRNAGTWAGDAWTPTYPDVQRTIDGNATVDINKLPEAMRPVTNNAFNGWLDGRSDENLAYWFLSDRGEAPDVVRRQRKFPKKIATRVIQHTSKNGVFGIEPIQVSEMNEQQLSDLKQDYIDIEFNGDVEAFNADIAERLRLCNATMKKNSEGSLGYKNAKRTIDYIEKYGFSLAVKNWLNDVRADNRAGNRPEPLETLSKAKEIVREKGLQSEFNEWLNGLYNRYDIKEVLFDGFTHSGDRKYVPNTIENASRIMREQGRNGSTGWSTSFANFVATIMKSLPTKDAIRNEKSRITSNHDDIEAFDKKWENVYFDLGQKCQPDAERTWDDYGFARLEEAVTKKNPVEYLKRQYGVELSKADVAQLNEMIGDIRDKRPAMYFETKFERPVGLNEFAAVVLPKDAPSEIYDAMKRAGLKIVEYERGNSADRKRALEEASADDGIRFLMNDTNTTDPNPTQAQKEAGNYKKKHLKVDGYDISIENERGSMRSGVDKDGTKWEQKMHNDYGYIRGTEGVDGDHIDLFLSDHYEKSGDVYVIDQVNKDGSFDEHKVMYGFDSEEEARDAYLSNYEKGWTGLGAITRVSRDDFKKWVDSSHRKTKPFAEYASVKRSLADDDDINFRIDEEDDNSEPSRRMGLANRISAAATEMSQNHQDNVNMRSQALAAIGHGGIKTIKRDRCPSQPLSGSDKKKINSLEKYRRIIDSQK
jgi:hypothetical protein